MIRGATVERVQDRVLLAGELDMTSAPRTEQELLVALEGDGPVFVDLSGLTFVDSIGLTVLIKAARHAPGRVTFGPGTGIVARTLEVAGADRFLRFSRDPVDGGT